LREERKLRVFENRKLRGIFEHSRDKVTSEWRKLYNEVFNDLYSSPSIFRVIKSRRMGFGACSAYGERKGVYRLLVGNPEGKRPVGRSRPIW
jgi:hypothetical protein